MHKHTSHADLAKTAIGYVHVSTQEQATEGGSLDTQREKLRAYCKTNGIRLVDTIADEGMVKWYGAACTNQTSGSAHSLNGVWGVTANNDSVVGFGSNILLGP